MKMGTVKAGGWLLAAAAALGLVAACGCGGGGQDNGGTVSGGFGADILGSDLKGIAVDDTYVYVSDLSRKQIVKFTLGGEFVMKWAFTPGTGPMGSVVYKGRLYVCDLYDKVQVFDLEGKHLATWTMPDTNPSSGGMGVVDIDVDENGIFYVLDNIDRSVKKFSAAGAYLGHFRVDSVDHMEWGPVGIVVHGGRVYQTDSANNKVNVWTVGGEYVKSWGTPGGKNGQFSNPLGIALMGDSIIVGDINLYPVFSRIQKFDLEGNYLATIQPDSGGFNPEALAVQSGERTIFVCSGSGNRILVVPTF